MLVFEEGLTGMETLLRLLSSLSCYISKVLFALLGSGLPEIVLYSAIFYHIRLRSQHTALAGILKPEIIKSRKKKNILNIILTFWAWLAQFITNLIYIMGYYLFYGRSKFHHSLLAVITVIFNFNILPIFYICMIDDEVKIAIIEKDYIRIVRLFLNQQ